MINPIKKLSFSTKLFITCVVVVTYYSLQEKVPVSKTLPESILQDISLCTQNNTLDFSCLKQKLQASLSKHAVSDILREIEIYSVDKKFSNAQTCHGMAHLLGEIAQDKYQDIATTLEACPNSCDYGCKHGAIVKYFKTNPGADQISTTFCNSQNGQFRSQKDVESCYHAVGHAWGELYSQDFEITAQKCNGLQSTARHKEECFRGATMEYILGSPENPSHFTPQKSLNDFCLSLPTEAHKACLEYSGFLIYPIQGIDEGINACNMINDLYKSTCFYYLGSALYFDYRDDPNQLVEQCEKTNQYFSSCINGALEVYVGEESYIPKAKQLCELLEAEDRIACLAHVEDRIKWATEI